MNKRCMNLKLIFLFLLRTTKIKIYFNNFSDFHNIIKDLFKIACSNLIRPNPNLFCYFCKHCFQNEIVR